MFEAYTDDDGPQPRGHKEMSRSREAVRLRSVENEAVSREFSTRAVKQRTEPANDQALMLVRRQN